MNPPNPTPWLALAACVIAGAAGALWLVRALQRRGRRAQRRATEDLAGTLAGFLEGGIEAQPLARAAAAVEAGTFWAALEALNATPAETAPPAAANAPKIALVGGSRPASGTVATRRAAEAEAHAARAAAHAARARLARALAGNPHLHMERRALEDDSPWRRELAARRLALLPTRASRDALRDAMRAGPEVVTFAAALALARHRDRESLAWLLARPDALARRTNRARVTLLASFGRAAAADLAATIEAGDAGPDLRRAAIDALALLRHDAAIPTIEQRLKDPEAEVRVAAARALGRLNAVTAVTSLMGALNDEAWPVRAQAARALGRIKAPIALLGLPARLADSAWWVRRHAAYALAEFGTQGEAELRRIAGGSPDPYARDIAREALEHAARTA